MNRIIVRAGAALGTMAIVALASGPALAAAHVSQASAEALRIDVAGTPSGLGAYSVYNDGNGQKSTGTTKPEIGVLKDNPIANLGVLAQEATATVADHQGHAAACSGIAGEGGTVAAVGDSTCISPGKALTLALGNLDLSKTLTIDPDSAIGALSAVNGLTTPVLSAITPKLSSALASTPLSSTGITSSLGAVQSSCAASTGTASGDTEITSGGSTSGPATVDLDVAGQNVKLVDLPIHPAVNQHVVVSLDKVLDEVLAGVNTDLTTTLNGSLAGGVALTSAIQKNIVDTLVAQVATQLKPLQDNVLDITLNKQSRPSSDSIDVTALDVQVLPAAKQFTGSSFIGVTIGHVTCGSNGKIAVAAPVRTPNGPSAVPTSVPAGLAGTAAGHSQHTSLVAGGALIALLMVASGTGLVIYRRHLL